MARIKAEVSEYERKRQENIAKTQALLRNLEMEAAEAGLAPTSKSASSARPKSRKPAPKKIKQEEETAPRRTSSRLRGIVADSEVAKRKAEDELEARREADKAKRQRISDAFNLSDIVVAGKGWDQSGNFLSIVGPAKPYERTFDADDVKETTDKELRGLREKFSGLELWDQYEPNDIKITPERIYSLGFHPTPDKPLLFAGDKLGNLGICDCSQTAPEIHDEDEDVDFEGVSITTLKPHTRTIHSFQFNPHDSNALYSASYDSSVRKVDLAKGVATEVYAPADKNEDAPLSGVEISKNDANMLYFTTLDGKFGMYDMRTPSEKAAGLEIFQLSEKKIGGFTLHPQLPHLVATASLDRTLKIWDLRKINGKSEWRLPALVGEHESKLSVSHAAWNAAGHVATASYDDTIKIHDFSKCADWKVGTSLTDAEMEPSVVVPHNNQTGRWVTILRAQWQLYPSDGVQRFCIGNMNRFVDIYTAKGQQLAQLGGDGITAVPAVAKFHPSEDWVAAGTASGKLCLWK